MTFARDGDHLIEQRDGEHIQLFPEGARDYVFKAFDAQITFVTDRTGRATELILHEGGIDTYLHRVK